MVPELWICILCEARLVNKCYGFVDMVTEMKSLPDGLCTSKERHNLYAEANPLEHALCFQVYDFYVIIYMTELRECY